VLGCLCLPATCATVSYTHCSLHQPLNQPQMHMGNRSTVIPRQSTKRRLCCAHSKVVTCTQHLVGCVLHR
jgi:hypothetical protein